MFAFEIPNLDGIAKEHPAFVHLPIAASLLLLPALMFWIRWGGGWRNAARLLAWSAFGGGAASMLTGLLWARSLDLIAPGALFPSRSGLLYTHQALAGLGLLAALTALILVERAKPVAALVLALLCAASWGAAGHWGGRMVFPDLDSPQTHLLPEAPWATSDSLKSS